MTKTDTICEYSHTVRYNQEMIKMHFYISWESFYIVQTSKYGLFIRAHVIFVIKVT